jgi:serine/alanine adding enzyme
MIPVHITDGPLVRGGGASALPHASDVAPPDAYGPEETACSVALSDDREAWDTYVFSRPEATNYHQFGWRDVVTRAFGHQPIYLAASDGSRLTGVLPLVEFRSWLFGTFAVSLPFVNYGGVVADHPEAARALLSRAEALRVERGWRHVELRHIQSRFPELPCKRHKVAMQLALPGQSESLWDGLDRKVKNQVRKAEKSGCVAENGGAELLADFYQVFAENMRDLGTPVYARRFFEEVLRSFPSGARVFVIRHGSQPIAASLTVGWRDRLEVPWASSLRAHNDKAPNMLLYWAMLQWATAADYGTFDFGRSTPHEGTFLFKKQWGAEPVALAWEYLLRPSGSLPDHSPKNPKFQLAVSSWRKLPLAVANALGPVVVRNIP